MFKIGEFSKITQVSVRMLRYYDENELLIPASVDEATGYRMYSSSQIDELNRILFLKELGFEVKQMKELLRDWNPEKIQDYLEKQKQAVQDNLKAEQERLIRIEGFMADLQKQDKKLNTQVILKSIPSYQVVSLRKVVKNYFCEGEMWQELASKLKCLGNEKGFSIYHDIDYREEDVDIEVCAICEPGKSYAADGLILCQTESIEHAACFMIYGPYENIGIAYKEFGYWLEQHPEYHMIGGNRQICHVGYCEASSPEEYVTELQVAIELSNK